MENKTSLFLKILFSLTVALLVTAFVLFAIASFAIGNGSNFLNPNAFRTLIYWILVIVGAMWYVYRFGFPRAKANKGAGEEIFQLLLSLFVPLLIGAGLALAVYYAFYGLAILLLASLGYIVAAALIISMFFAVRFLIDIYFKPKAENKNQQIWMVLLSLLISIVLLVFALLLNGVAIG